jgi:hypothetical protein
MRRYFLLFTSLLVLSACGNKVKETIGVVSPGPDEYKVHRNKPLEVPPHFNLPSSVKSDAASEDYNSSKEFNEGEKALIDEM